MSDNRKEAEEKMAKAIFISADCWLSVFDLLPPRQLGHGIAFVSHRFDFYVDEHFKTRRWALKGMEIKSKIEADGTNGIEIVNYVEKNCQFHKKRCQRKLYIDQNAITFLQHFRQLFASCPINLAINTSDNRTLVSFLRNIFPMIARNICAIQLPGCFVPSILNGCPSLRVVNANSQGFFAEFPADDSAMASDGQALAKWLFTPRPDNVPKVFKCLLQPWWYEQLVSSIEYVKVAFANASSTANFIVVILSTSSFHDDFVVPFDQTNELTREQLTLKRMNDVGRFILIRCPIVRDMDKWAKWEKEAIDWQFNGQWNRIDI